MVGVNILVDTADVRRLTEWRGRYQISILLEGCNIVYRWERIRRFLYTKL